MAEYNSYERALSVPGRIVAGTECLPTDSPARLDPLPPAPENVKRRLPPSVTPA